MKQIGDASRMPNPWSGRLAGSDSHGTLVDFHRQENKARREDDERAGDQPALLRRDDASGDVGKHGARGREVFKQASKFLAVPFAPLP